MKKGLKKDEGQQDVNNRDLKDIIPPGIVSIDQKQGNNIYDDKLELHHNGRRNRNIKSTDALRI